MMLKTGYVKIASPLVTVAHSCSYTSYLFQVTAFLSVKMVMKTKGKTSFLVENWDCAIFHNSTTPKEYILKKW
jgi:hypothetical protein